jgi:hypothetical protein
MTSQSPRIYIYKITFEEVLYYYYGVHKEKKYNEYYMGSPVTHKWVWDFYTPEKQILELFDFTDEGWMKAQEIEKRLIKPVYNTDKWCLNENCMGTYSLKQASKAGKIGGNKNKELGLGICGLTFEERSKNGKISGKIGGKIGGNKNKELRLGVCGLTPEKRSEIGKIGGKVGGEKTKELKLGFHAYTTEERKELGKKCYDEGKGIASLTKEQLRENAKKADEFNRKNKIGFYSITPEQRRETASKTNSQKWMCLETGYITTSGPLTLYQKKRGINTSKRIRVS